MSAISKLFQKTISNSSSRPSSLILSDSSASLNEQLSSMNVDSSSTSSSSSPSSSQSSPDKFLSLDNYDNNINDATNLNSSLQVDQTKSLFTGTATYQGWVVLPTTELIRTSDRASVIAIAQRILLHKKDSPSKRCEKAKIKINTRNGVIIESTEAIEPFLAIPDDWKLDDDIDQHDEEDTLKFDYNDIDDNEDDRYACREGRQLLLRVEPAAIVCIVLSKDKGLVGIVTNSFDDNDDACLGCDVLSFSSNKTSVAFAAAYKTLVAEFNYYQHLNKSLNNSFNSSRNSNFESDIEDPYVDPKEHQDDRGDSSSSTSPLPSPPSLRRNSADHGTHPSGQLTNSGHFKSLLTDSPKVSTKVSPKGSPRMPTKSWSTRLIRRNSPRSKKQNPKILTGMANVFVTRAAAVDLSEADSGYLRTETISQILMPSAQNSDRDTYLVCNCAENFSTQSATHSRTGFIAVQAS